MVSREGTSRRAATAAPRRWTALLMGAVIGALVLLPSRGVAQAGQPGVAPNEGKHQPGALLALGQNYPNPFSPATRIPFSVGDPPVCSDPVKRYRVSLKVYNLLAQPVAVPVIAQATSSSAPIGQPVQALELPCGQYTAYWDGTGLASNRAVPSGLYLYRLEINGKPVAARKMMVQR